MDEVVVTVKEKQKAIWQTPCIHILEVSDTSGGFVSNQSESQTFTVTGGGISFTTTGGGS
jgi:hypothetical protein